MKKKRKKTSSRPIPGIPEGECVIPPAIPKPELHKLMFRHFELEVREARDENGPLSPFKDKSSDGYIPRVQ